MNRERLQEYKKRKLRNEADTAIAQVKATM